MTIRTIYHAADGQQFDSRAEAQQYERAIEFINWMKATAYAPVVPDSARVGFAKNLARRWSLRDKEAPPKRGKPSFTGGTCVNCGGRLERIHNQELCVSCEPKLATQLRGQEE